MFEWIQLRLPLYFVRQHIEDVFVKPIHAPHSSWTIWGRSWIRISRKYLFIGYFFFVCFIFLCLEACIGVSPRFLNFWSLKIFWKFVSFRRSSLWRSTYFRSWRTRSDANRIRLWNNDKYDYRRMPSTMFIGRHVLNYIFVSSKFWTSISPKNNSFYHFNLRYFCRSLTYDPISKACVLSSEDSASLSDQEVATMTGTGYYYFEILCMALGKQTVAFILNNFKLCQIMFSMRKNEIGIFNCYG